MDLRARLSALIAARVVVGTLLLGWAILIQVNAPGAFPADPLFLLIGTTYALSVVYITTLRYVDRHAWLVDVQLGADALLVSAFIQVTGGITSYFSSLYLLPIIAASTIRFRRGALQVASLSAILYLALVAGQYTSSFDHLPASWQSSIALPGPRFAQYTVAINLFGFMAVALLSGSLAEGLRSAGVRLAAASHEIADLRAFNERIIDSLVSGLVTTDLDGRVLTFNRGAAAITGLRPEDALGHDVGEVLQLPVPLRARFAALSHGGPSHVYAGHLGYDTRSVRADVERRTTTGTSMEIGLTATTLTFPDGRPGYLITFQDVTGIKRLEHEARLQQRLAAVGEMAAGIAHEIRNPLASMSGSIQVLRQELALNQEQAQLMDIVLRESERLNDTIRSFLAYARPQRLATTRLDLRTIVQDAAVLLRNSSDVREGHVIDVDTPSEPVWYDADENQIRQIIWNLATNGLRAMPDGGRLWLSVSTDRAGSNAGDVVVAVRDEGCGIPAEECDSIFQPFRSSFGTGTGLGLAIVHRIVTGYNGVIQVSSTVGVGTTFSVRLPLSTPMAVAS
jgi:two-component system, NtrC family, sensor histidine kinase PilS